MKMLVSNPIREHQVHSLIASNTERTSKYRNESFSHGILES